MYKLNQELKLIALFIGTHGNLFHIFQVRCQYLRNSNLLQLVLYISLQQCNNLLLPVRKHTINYDLF